MAFWIRGKQEEVRIVDFLIQVKESISARGEFVFRLRELAFTVHLQSAIRHATYASSYKFIIQYFV